MPKIDRHPSIFDFDRGKLDSIPNYNPGSDKSWQVDLRSYKFSELDLSKDIDNLLYADFDDKTIWPPSDKMPKDFNPKNVMDLGKNPGLSVRNLHLKGITGKNVGIGIIDQPLLVDHQEYKNQLKLYEELDDVYGDQSSQMHGSAVASIAVGTTVGVAPEADLYYIATNFGGMIADYNYFAQGIKRIIDINKILPADRKIRVISVQLGWRDSSVIGYKELKEAYEEAKNSGLLIVCSSIEEVHGFKFHGLGRPSISDPDKFNSYEPGMFWATNYYTKGKEVNDRLLIPMDSRTTASPTGSSDYAFYREGGWSWAIPYIAGVYALAAQVDPKITPERFWDLAMKTGKTIKLQHDGKVMNFGPIINPVALIDELKKK